MILIDLPSAFPRNSQPLGKIEGMIEEMQFITHTLKDYCFEFQVLNQNSTLQKSIIQKKYLYLHRFSISFNVNDIMQLP